MELNVGGEKVSVGIDLKEPQGFKIVNGDMKEWERQQRLRYDEQHPEFIGLVMTDKNRWDYQKVVDRQSTERAIKSFYNPLTEKLEDNSTLLAGDYKTRSDNIQNWINKEEDRIRYSPVMTVSSRS